MERPLILAVEDEEEMRELYELTLSSEGFDVVTVAHPSQALDAIENRLPDAFVLDIVMSEETSPSLLDELRIDPRTSAIPIVVVSGVTRGHKRWRDQGPWDTYFTKPVNLHELSETLWRLIRREP